jgi:hypothetical protein
MKTSPRERERGLNFPPHLVLVGLLATRKMKEKVLKVVLYLRAHIRKFASLNSSSIASFIAAGCSVVRETPAGARKLWQGPGNSGKMVEEFQLAPVGRNALFQRHCRYLHATR